MRKNAGKGLMLCAAAVLLTAACGRRVPVVETETKASDPLKENRLNANRYVAQTEKTQIDSYAERRGWKMQTLSGGARMMPTREGKGKSVDYEDTVSIRYSVEDLAGRTIYKDIMETIVVGRMKPNQGVDAVLRKMRRGGEAVAILPSEQAFGVIGDGERIGSRMVLVYKIEVI